MGSSSELAKWTAWVENGRGSGDHKHHPSFDPNVGTDSPVILKNILLSLMSINMKEVHI